MHDGNPDMFGGSGGRVEVDETFIGYRDGVARKQGSAHKLRVVALIDEFVTHGRSECDRGDVSTNAVEGFFSIFKRGMRGIYQHCHQNHLHRYLA